MNNLAKAMEALKDAENAREMSKAGNVDDASFWMRQYRYWCISYTFWINAAEEMGEI